MEDFLYRATPWWRTLVLHNWPIMICGLLILWASIRAYIRSDRPSLLLLYCFLVFAAAFEYQKHAVPTIQGTTDYLFEIWPTQRQIAQSVLLDMLPSVFYLLALLFLVLSLLLSRRNSRSDF